MHSALVPPGALHHRVTAALANWQLDDAEELLAGVDRDPSPYVAADPAADAGGDTPVSLGKAWADTLRAELLVRRLRKAGFTLVGDAVDDAEPLDLHVGVATAPVVADDGEPATVVGWRALFDSADLNLFSAKRSGRNRVRAPGVMPTQERPADDGDDA